MRHPQNQTKLIGVINILYLSQNQEKNLVSHHFWGPQSIKMKIAPVKPVVLTNRRAGFGRLDQ